MNFISSTKLSSYTSIIPGCSLDTEGIEIFGGFIIFFDVISFNEFIEGGLNSFFGIFLNELFSDIKYLIINSFY